ncbi:MAG TPA: hypothetical protein VNG13_14665 [Mycobacteriales bacterium]|nr:hypothetical protein [Mycobacteriales bacterium]
MTTWDRKSSTDLAKAQDAALRAQLADALVPFSPFWRDRLRVLGIGAGSIRGVPGLSGIPAVGERDVCPDGDPAGMAALVLQVSERGWPVHANGLTLRRAMLRRLASADAYRQVVEADSRPTSFVYAGLGFRYPLASTRGDLDLVTRAGARLWQVLGLRSSDVLLAALPNNRGSERVALRLAALGAGSPAMLLSADVAEISTALRYLPATALAVPADTAADLVEGLVGAGSDLSALHTLLLVGVPTAAERRAAEVALAAGRGAADGVTLAVHAPSGSRVLWGECRRGAGGSTGLHTYPDLDLVELVDPDTADGYPGGGAGEIVLTQLGFRGSALLRWRTGDVVGGPIETAPCPACGRTVPRVPSLDLRRGAMVVRVTGSDRAVDLRAVAGALAGRTDLSDWRLELSRRGRDGTAQLLVHLAAPGDPAEAAVGAAADIRAASGQLPSQIVGSLPGQFIPPEGSPLTRRIVLRG